MDHLLNPEEHSVQRQWILNTSLLILSFHIEYLSRERLLITQGIVELWNGEIFFNTHTCPMRARQSTLVKFMLTILYFREAFSSQQTERKEQTSPFPFPSHIPSLSHCQPLPSFGTFVQIDKPLWTLHQHPEPIVCTAVHSGVGHSMGWHKHMTHIRY